ncbi:hypothetical protein AALP_AA2G257000 [Arabis alpina]|uniref:WRKY domain-containing protein n=1 Tax=Arabis alpina TaxID=50452 RepID=A0A087HJY9_ARAAL|nr:hypothetical protein AALP_AA2G257000 [Arabis alpina]
MFPGANQAVEALLRGQESANRLKTVLENPRTSLVPTQHLFETVLDSFSVALSLFTNSTSSNPQPHYESPQSTATPSVARKSPKKKRCMEDGLEHYKVDSPTLLQNDGFSWRKYGQKKIKTSTHLRSYFRCTYAKDINCNAMKRVQKIQDSPSVYRTTYIGKHICEEVRSFSQPNDDIANGSKILRFDQIDQAMPESSVMPQLVPVDHQAIVIDYIDQFLNQECVMPQLVSVEHQETTEDEGIDKIMNQECDNNNKLVIDDEFWTTYPFSPDNSEFKRRLDEYRRQVKESDDFDVEPLIGPHGMCMTGLVSYDCQGYWYPDRALVKRYATVGLDRYNILHGTNFKLCALIKFNVTSNCYNSYYITLAARDKDSTQKTFQVQVDEKSYGYLDVVCSVARVKDHQCALDSMVGGILPDWPSDDDAFNDRDRYKNGSDLLDDDWIHPYLELAVFTKDRFIYSDEDLSNKLKIVKVAKETSEAKTSIFYIAFTGMATGEHVERKAIIKRVVNERGFLFLKGHLCKGKEDLIPMISLEEYCKQHANDSYPPMSWEECTQYVDGLYGRMEEEGEDLSASKRWEESCKQRGVDPYPWGSTPPMSWEEIRRATSSKLVDAELHSYPAQSLPPVS